MKNNLGFGNWASFRLSDLFDIRKGKRLTKQDMTEGKTPFIGSSESNNAWTTKIGSPAIHPGNTITVNYDGSVAEAFYQPKPFWALDSVNVLYPKFNLNPLIGMFLVTVIRKEKYRFNYGRKWKIERMVESEIYLPVHNNMPDWSGIEKYIRSLSILQKHSLNDTFHLKGSMSSDSDSLDIDNWSTFNLSDLFDIKKGKRLTKEDMVSGDTPFIGAIDSNNGWREFINLPAIHPGNTITVNYNGNGVADAYYQPLPFYASDDVNVLHPKFQINVFNALFICTIIRREKYKFSYGRKWNKERMEKSAINLPAKNGKADFLFMEAYIKSLPYSKSLITESILVTGRTKSVDKPKIEKASSNVELVEKCEGDRIDLDKSLKPILPKAK